MRSGIDVGQFGHVIGDGHDVVVGFAAPILIDVFRELLSVAD